MRKIGLKNRRKRSARQIATAALVGSAVGAAVGLLMAPSSGREMLRRIRGQAMDPHAAQERAKTAEGNVENQARELAGDVQGTVSRRRRATTPNTEELGL